MAADGHGEPGGVGAGAKGQRRGVYGSIAVIPAVRTLLQLTAVNAHGTSDAIFLEATSVAGLPAEVHHPDHFRCVIMPSCNHVIYAV